MNDQVRLSKSVTGELELQAARRVIVKNQFFGMGAEVAAFERELQAYLGTTRDVVCVNTGTSALHLALQAAGVGPGDEVISPTITFVATYQAITATGATVVPCDVRQEDGWIDLEDAESRITARTKAIVPVHYAGGVGDLHGLHEMAQRHGLRVIEDAAHAFGTTYRGLSVGAQGDIVCFSFDGIKNITAGEGGAIVTGDAAVAHKAREGRLLGFQIGNETRIGSQRWVFDVVDQGWRYHMSDLFAAIGRAQLTRLDSEFKPRRIQLARRYDEMLALLPHVSTMPFDYNEVVPFNYPVRIHDGRRDAVRDRLMAEGIECGLYYKPLHLLTRYGSGSVSLPNAEQFARDVLTLPLHPDVSDADQERSVEMLSRALLSAGLVAAGSR